MIPMPAVVRWSNSLLTFRTVYIICKTFLLLAMTTFSEKSEAERYS